MTQQDKTQPERRCIVTRRSLSANKMIRFVLAPDDRVVPDLAEKLPGRGAWVSCMPENIAKAQQKQLFAKAFQQPVIVPESLHKDTVSLLEKSCLNLIALCRKSGVAVSGYQKVVETSDRDDGLFLLAKDASENAASKLAGLADGRAIFRLFSSADLAKVFGRETAVNVFIAATGPYQRLKKDLNRLFYLCGECANTARDRKENGI